MKIYIPKDRISHTHELFKELIESIKTNISSSSTNMVLNQNKLADRMRSPSRLLYNGYLGFLP
jgi:transcriptional regulator CtsR